MGLNSAVTSLAFFKRGSSVLLPCTEKQLEGTSALYTVILLICSFTLLTLYFKFQNTARLYGNCELHYHTSFRVETEDPGQQADHRSQNGLGWKGA